MTLSITDPVLFKWYHDKKLTSMITVDVDDFLYAGAKLSDKTPSLNDRNVFGR